MNTDVATGQARFWSTVGIFARCLYSELSMLTDHAAAADLDQAVSRALGRVNLADPTAVAWIPQDRAEFARACRLLAPGPLTDGPPKPLPPVEPKVTADTPGAVRCAAAECRQWFLGGENQRYRFDHGLPVVCSLDCRGARAMEAIRARKKVAGRVA